MAANPLDTKFSLSWHDSAWIPILNAENVLDYFCQRSNTFYDKTCNNEHVKMQRLHPSQLQFMAGIEYELIHAQDPILYVIKKQTRHSPTQVTALAFYYVLAGVVYQAPDLGSLINSRLLSTVYKLQSAFAEAQSYAKYTPSKGYWWQFNDDTPAEIKKKDKKKQNKAQEPSTVFQRQRVDLLLANFTQKFPPKVIQQKPKDTSDTPTSETPTTEATTDVKESNTTQRTIVKNGSPEQVTIAQMIAASADSTKSSAPPPKKKKKD